MLLCSDFLDDKSPISNNRMAPCVQTCTRVSSVTRIPDYYQLKNSHFLILKIILTLVWGYWIYTKGEGKTNMN